MTGIAAMSFPYRIKRENMKRNNSIISRLSDMCLIILPAVMVSVLSLSGCEKHAPQTGMTLPAPEGLTFTLQIDTDTTALLEWEPVLSASHYYVMLQESESGTEAGELADVTETAVLFENLEPGMSYYCRVRAINGMAYSDFAKSDVITVPEQAPDTSTDTGTDTGVSSVSEI